MSLPEALNAAFIESQYHQWRADPESVSSDWRYFFQGFELADSGGIGDINKSTGTRVSDQVKVEKLIDAYRRLGHMLACMDPLSACPTSHPLLALSSFGLKDEDLKREFYCDRFSLTGVAALKDIVAWLRETYCRAIGVEYMHLQDPAERQWLEARMEPVKNKPPITASECVSVLKQLIQAAVFERFLNKKYLGITRFSLEGGDGVIPLINTIVGQAAGSGCREVILGMAHRGRLNVQSHVLQKPYERIFEEFESCYDPTQVVGSGDVKYHNGHLADIEWNVQDTLRILLANNPSHLEAVGPVVQGLVRARQELRPQKGVQQVLPLLIHGDAAFAGQGIVAETLNMSQLKGYQTGGSIHVVINNQIGYTTLPEDARSTRYSTDIAKMLMVPIFHVHGENAEAIVHVARMATDYRYRYGKDVVIDIVCYRRYGHNEGDEPYFTQPLMVERIKDRPSPYELYAQTLVDQQRIDARDVDAFEKECEQKLEAAYDAVHGNECRFPEPRFFEDWDAVEHRISDDPVETAVDAARMRKLARRLYRLPPAFSVYPKLERLMKKRHEAVEKNRGIDWATAEALAFATLVTENTPVRLSGQDVARGTFSQRHSTVTDVKTGEVLTPLNHLEKDQAAFMVYNSLLAEASVLGFEYGYSSAHPGPLVIWEAQFGDFVNNAQAIVDLFVASGESKWQRLSGLTLLLPHGYEGLGPEHSSARLERFLQLCADDNLQVCNLTTPAQYFHALRRQVKAPFRKPLVVMTPKSLLRHPMAVSTLDAFEKGRLLSVLDDPADNAAAAGVIVCSGKIYYQLLQQRKALDKQSPAIVRLERFYPFPARTLKTVLAGYDRATSFYWVQEEPRNMGGWAYVRPRIEAILGKSLNYIGRRAAASPATGFPEVYKREQQRIVDEAVGAG